MKNLKVMLFFILLCNICFAGWWGSAVVPTGGTVTYVVAANDTSADEKARANYVCDGVSDEVEIQAAIDALSDSGGIVQLLPGNYYKSNASGIALESNMEFILSKGAVINMVANAGNEYIMIGSTDESNVTISGGGTLDGKKALHTTITGNAYGIYFVRTDGCRIKDFTIKDIGTFTDESGYGIYFNDCNDGTVTNITLNGNKREGLVCYNGSDNNIISNVHSYDSGDRDFVVHDSSGNLFVNCVGLNAANNGFDIVGSGTVLDNQIKDCLIDGATVRGINIAASSHRTIISGSTFINCGSHGIYCISTNCLINNNYSYNNGDAGIYASGSGHLITNNYCISNGTGGSFDSGITGYMDDCFISGNKCISNGKYGIRFMDGAENNIASNNDLRTGGGDGNYADLDGSNVDSNNFE